MKAIDDEIRLIEQRMARRRHEVADTARVAKERAKRKLLSPTGLITAGALGFLATMMLMRKRHAPVYVKQDKASAGKAMGLAGMLMPVALAIVRAQFGSPAGMAAYVLSRLKKEPSPRSDARREPPVMMRRAAEPPGRPVHPAR